MDPILKKLHEQYNEKSARQSDLIKKGELSADETTELKTLTDDISALAAEAKNRNDILKSWAEAEGFFKGQPNLGTGELPNRETGKKVGTDLVEIKMNGKSHQVDFEGFGLSEKVYRAICEPSYAKSYEAYLRSGINTSAADLKTLQEGVDTAGGYWVPPQWLAQVIAPDPRDSNLLDMVYTVPTSSDRIDIPKWTYAGGDNDAAGTIFTSPIRKKRSGETGSPATGTEPTMGLQEVGVYEASLEIPVTRSLVQDSAFDISSWVQDQMRSAWRLDTEREIAIGDGINKPMGIMFNPGGTDQPPSVNIGNPMTGDGVIKLHYALPSQYRRDAVYVMEDSTTWRELVLLKGNDNHYIGGLANVQMEGLSQQRDEILLGKSVKFNPFYSIPGANNYLISFGNYRKAYYYALRMGVSIQIQDLPRDPMLYLVMRTRDGGRTVFPQALRVGKQA